MTTALSPFPSLLGKNAVPASGGYEDQAHGFGILVSIPDLRDRIRQTQLVLREMRGLSPWVLPLSSGSISWGSIRAVQILQVSKPATLRPRRGHVSGQPG